jgi:hypothetical protein
MPSTAPGNDFQAQERVVVPPTLENYFQVRLTASPTLKTYFHMLVNLLQCCAFL